MNKKDFVEIVYFIPVILVGIVLILFQIGAVYQWQQGTCFIGAYYEGGDSLQMVDGVRVEFKDFWGYSQVVTASKNLVNITLYFHGWYKIEATYKGSVKTRVITTVGARSTYIGYVYIVLDRDDTIKSIEYVIAPF